MNISPYLGRFAYTLVGATLLPASVALAADATWNVGGGSSTAWGTGANWTPTASPGATSGTANQDTATFLANILTVSKSIDIGSSSRNIKNIVLDYSGASGTYTYSLVGAARGLILSAGGETKMIGAMTTATNALIDPNAGTVTFAGDYTFTSDATATSGTPSLTIGGRSTLTTLASLGNITLTLKGATTSASTAGTVAGTALKTGVGGYVSSAITNGASGTVVALSKEGAGTWQLNSANTFTGGLAVKQGTINANNNGALGAGAVTLGDNATGQDAAILLSSDITVSNAITVASGSGLRILGTNAGSSSTGYSGAITLNNPTHGLRLQNQSGNQKLTVSGGITGTGNVEIYNNSTASTAASSAGIVFGTHAINNAGTVSNVSPGSAPLTQEAGGVIGSNVTEFIQNSGTSTTTLSLANSYGVTRILAGTLATSEAGTLGTGDVIVNGGSLILGSSISLSDTAILSFIASGGPTITLNNDVSDVVYGIIDITDGASIGSGTWTASDLNEFFGTNAFTGDGKLTTITAVPEPSTVAMAVFAFGVLVIVHFRRRSQLAAR